MIATSKFLLSGFKHWTRSYIAAVPSEYYSFPSPRPELLLLPILSISCIILLLLASRIRKRSTETTSCALSSDAARALSVIFTPASGGWSSHLASHFRRTRLRTSAFNSQSIQVDLSELLENIFSGNIELRDNRDLSNLFQGRLSVHDLSITLSAARSWWFIAAKWIILQQFHMSPTRAAGHSQDSAYNLDLDHIPCHKIEREVLRIQRTHISGATFSIEFTCFAPGIASWLSPHYILCLITFLYASRTRRNSVPLALSLQKVIGFLSNDDVSILTITNISSEQAAILCLQEKDMVYNRNLRNRLVSDEGLVGWRRKRFMLLWEAGLLSAGLLFRWRIILKAN